MPNNKKTLPAPPKTTSSVVTEPKSILKKAGTPSAKKDTKAASKKDTKSTSKKPEKQVSKRNNATPTSKLRNLPKSGEHEYYEQRVKFEVFGNLVRKTTLIISTAPR